jgi:hypothetical protein
VAGGSTRARQGRSAETSTLTRQGFGEGQGQEASELKKAESVSIRYIAASTSAGSAGAAERPAICIPGRTVKALQQLFRAVPPDLGLAYIVVRRLALRKPFDRRTFIWHAPIVRRWEAALEETGVRRSAPCECCSGASGI